VHEENELGHPCLRHHRNAPIRHARLNQFGDACMGSGAGGAIAAWRLNKLAPATRYFGTRPIR
jgi:hypothetical protein